MGSGPHRAGKAAFEEAIDLTHLAASGGFAIDGAESGQHILAQIPERFEVACEAHTLRHSLDRMAAMDLQERQHGGADLPHLPICGAAKVQPGKGQESEETAG